MNGERTTLANMLTALDELTDCIHYGEHLLRKHADAPHNAELLAARDNVYAMLNLLEDCRSDVVKELHAYAELN